MAIKKTAPKKTAAAAKGAPVKKSSTAPSAAPAAKAPADKAPAAKMTKTQIIRSMAERLAVSPKQIAGFFALMGEMAVAETESNGEFTIPGIGKLVKAQRQARTGRNPATGETINIAAKTTVKFRIAKPIKDSISPPAK